MGENGQKREWGVGPTSLRLATELMVRMSVDPVIRWPSMRRAILIIGLSFGLSCGPALGPAPSMAQGTGVPRAAPVETAPLPAPGASPQVAPGPTHQPDGTPGVTLTQEPPASSAPSATQRSQAATPGGARPTLVPSPGDPLDVAEVTLPGKPAAVLPGTSSWDEGFDDLKKAFEQIEGELAKAGVRPAGRPLTVFLETDDMGFRYEAMVPVDAATTNRPNLSAEVGFGRTPEGKAYHFVHKGPYENIDSTYETITAYLDAKGIVAKDVFIEEYVTDLTDRTDDALEINIFVQPR
jgi:effector-binding domain-containing protein